MIHESYTENIKMCLKKVRMLTLELKTCTKRNILIKLRYWQKILKLRTNPMTLTKDPKT